MRLFQVINSYISKQKTRRALGDLPEHLYKDIGKTPAQVAQEFNKSSLTLNLVKKMASTIKSVKFKPLKA